ncbi:MAG TPA: hypothetical protein VLA75_07895 [Thermoanaerobaculia bacterium]|nr:hypothetical protein [Thermoanaerobaculia bacterium]
MTPLVERPVAWPGAVAVGALLWSLLVWRGLIVGVGWQLCRVPMGLGGALYPKLFAVPVLVGAFLLAVLLVRLPWPSRKSAAAVSLAVPIALATLLLVIFCPMDGEGSFLSALLGCLF